MTIPASFAGRSASALLVVIALVLGGCSSAASTPAASTAAVSPSAASSAAASESAEPSQSESASGEEEYKIEVATSGSIGKYLTGEDGKTLYIFKNDTTANQSTCTGDCATKWPPFTIDEDEDVEAGDGVTGKIATFDRADGKTQVSYKGQPLYYFASDSKAGDTNGQGIGNVWFAATP
jgi:predicted lipoprotein with Yx(FWY)xxD motif